MIRISTSILVLLLSFTAALADPTPEIVIQVGHGNVVRTAAMSVDGKLLASGSMDGTVKIWEVRTGRLIRTLVGHKNGVRAVIFHPDGKQLVSGGGDRVVKVWDLVVGEQEQTLVGPSQPVATLTVNGSGSQIAAGSEDGKVYVWNTETGELLRSIAAHTNGALGIAFTPHGRLLSGGADNTVKIWSEGETPLKTIGGHGSAVTSVAINPEGDQVASACEDGKVRAMSIETGKILWTAEGHQQPVQSVSYTTDGKAVVSGSWDNTVRYWSADSGHSLGNIDTGETLGFVGSVPDGRVLSGGGDNCVTLWTADGGLVKRFEGQGSWVYSVASNVDYIATGSADGGLRLWDRAEGRMLRVYDGHTAAVTSAAISGDGQWLVSGSGDSRVSVWDLVSGERLNTFQDHEAWVYSVAVSPDGKWLASGSADETTVVRNLASGKIVHTLESQSGEITSVAITPDGTTLITASGDETLKTWDLGTGAEGKILKGHTGWVFQIAVTTNGRQAVSVSEDKTARVWDLATGAQRHRIDLGVAGVSVAISDDGKSAIAGAMDGRLIRLDLVSGEILGTTRGHTSRVTGMSLSPDGKTLYTASWDGSVKVRSPEGRERASLISFRTGDWLASTPEGHFVSSIDGSRYVAWRVGLDVFPFERYEEVYRNPDIIRQRLTGPQKSAAAATSKAQADPVPAPTVVGNPPRVSLINPAPGAITGEETIDVDLEATDSKGIQAVSISMNGRPMQVNGKSEIPLGETNPEQRVQIKVPLVYGPNRIEVTAINSEGLRSDPDTVTVNLEEPLNPVEGNLWVLVAGVSEHSNPRYSLNYPAVDASAIAEMLEAKGASIYGEVHVKVLNDKESTTPNIQGALNEISEKIGKEDVLMMFIAGHGVRTKAGEYYFITHDANPVRLKETAFSWQAFEDLLRTMPARGVVLFADTCHSGDIVKPASRFASTDEMTQGLVKKSGVVVFVSSQGCEYSLESTEWGHGAFTFALLEAMEGKANFQPDKVITMAELQLYVPTRVRRITKNKQHPRIPRLDNFDPEMPVVGAK